jgi:hypothetical protein
VNDALHEVELQYQIYFGNGGFADYTERELILPVHSGYQGVVKAADGF